MDNTNSDPLDDILDFSQMRTERLPEDEVEPTTQVFKHMPKSLTDAINGVTEDNPNGIRQMVEVRLHNDLVEQLKTYAKENKIGYPSTLFTKIFEDFLQK